MTKPMAAYFTALAVCCAPAAAQQPPENPIPASGGALIIGERDPHALDAGWEGEKTCELLQDNEEVLAFKCTFAPGEGHERHFHRPHFGYIVEGGKMRITDETGTRVQKTPAGVSWWSDGVGWHVAENIGKTTTSYVIVEPKKGQRIK